MATEFLFLNTRQPPFTSLKARQAVNYAIDRARILQLSHLAPGQAAVTCQLLPADFPGHRSYCPYTTGAKDGIWHGPDMAKARRLAKDSHTTNVPVTVWIHKDLASRALNSYLVRVLKDLGYRAHQRTVPDAQFYPAVSSVHSKVQAGLNGWGADFPTASEFFLPVLSCRSYYQDSNEAEFCDPHADRLASQAQAAQLTDPAAARRLWAQVDRIVTDQAPWVPILSFGDTTFVSARAGNYQESPISGPLYDQMWVR
ncbi:MAG TPA: ABC transporter substrate-binding protein [Streptosporangiaceae bacterium]|nr:ABC transporter substrate-binding protein [Streptosporangiaceae bacterium]